MTPELLHTILLYSGIAYITSLILLPIIVYNFTEELTARTLLVSLIPIANTYSTIVGLVSVMTHLYNKYNSVVLVKKKKKLKIPSPKK